MGYGRLLYVPRRVPRHFAKIRLSTTDRPARGAPGPQGAQTPNLTLTFQFARRVRGQNAVRTVTEQCQ